MRIRRLFAQRRPADVFATIRTFACAGGVLAMALATVSPVCAQTSQRSSIVGIVTDTDGRAIAGASVTLSGRRVLGGPRTQGTDARGEYRFAGLLPGTYDVTAEAKGFRATSRRDVALPVETTYDVNLVLTVAGVSESIDVHARAALLDARNSATPVTFESAVLHDVPTARTLQSVLALAPGVVTSAPLFGVVGEVAYGGTQGSNALAVDGVSLTEGFLGEQWSQVNYNWLEEVQVVAPGAAAEYGGFTGALANGVLRSGSNRTSGLAEWLTIRPNWTGDNLDGFPAGSPKPTPRSILAWWDLNGQVGAPIVRDRLWVFGGANTFHHDYRPFGYAGPDATEERTSRVIAKIDASASPGVNLQGFVTMDATDRAGGRLAADNPTPAGSPDETIRTHTWNARATWARGSSTVLEARASGNTGTSRQEPHPPATREGPPIVFDGTTGTQCCNSPWAHVERSSTLVGASIGHYRVTSRGDHDVRVGLEFERAPADTANGIPAGRGIWVLDGDIVQVEEWAGDRVRTTGGRVSLYAQDRWSIGDRLTVEPGLRVEWHRGSVPGQGTVFETTPIAPRIGAAWDVTGRQTTVLRAHYGRYHDQQFGNLYAFTDPTGHSPHTILAPVDGTLVPLFSYSEQVHAAKPGSLRQSHVDQFVAGVERALGANTTVQAQYIGRRVGNLIGFIDDRIDEMMPYDFQDPGPDGRLGTADDGGTVVVYKPYASLVDTAGMALRLGNPVDAYRRYDALQLIATRRFAARWQYQVSYTWSRSVGTVGNEYHTNAGYGSLSPLGSVGSDLNAARAGETRSTFDYSEFKAFGSYRAPWLGGFTVGGVFRWHDGARWGRMAFAAQPFPTTFRPEPAGSRRAPSVGGLDLRVEKTIRLPRSATVGLYVDVFNATNVGRALSYVGFSGPRFGRVTAWTDPRTARLGVRVGW